MKLIAFILVLLFSLSSMKCDPVDDEKTESTSFTHNNGHKYYVVYEPMTWADALRRAKSMGGYLVNIDDIDEQNAIQNHLGQNASKLVASLSKASDGGGAAYLWIGATDETTEGTWVWNSATGTKSLGSGTGNSWSGSVYQKWGKSGGTQKEPDDYANNQDYAAICFSAEGWPVSNPNTLGAQYDWNDVAGTNQLYFIVEVG